VTKFFWHTSCDGSGVARKSYNPELSPTAVQIAAIRSRLAAIESAGQRIPPRIRRVAPVRRRLPVVMMPQPAHAVKIRHTLQNVGSGISETQPVQNQRA
jgi:hypothetical protein